MLIKSGADKDALDKQLRTPMHLAAIAGRITVIKLFIQNGTWFNSLACRTDKSLSLPLVLIRLENL